MKILVFYILGMLIFFTSCNGLIHIEKKNYSRGYTVFNSTKLKVNKTANLDKIKMYESVDTANLSIASLQDESSGVHLNNTVSSSETESKNLLSNSVNSNKRKGKFLESTVFGKDETSNQSNVQHDKLQFQRLIKIKSPKFLRSLKTNLSQKLEKQPSLPVAVIALLMVVIGIVLLISSVYGGYMGGGLLLFAMGTIVALLLVFSKKDVSPATYKTAKAAVIIAIGFSLLAICVYLIVWGAIKTLLLFLLLILLISIIISSFRNKREEIK